LTLYYCGKIPLAFLINLPRMKNPIQIMRRRVMEVT